MSPGRDKDLKVNKTGLRRILGRIFCAKDDADDNIPFLLIKDGRVRVPLPTLISAIEQSPDDFDCDIAGRLGIPGVQPADIEIVRAYIHRFGADVANPLPIESHNQHVLLLDENIPQPAMLCLSQIFGWATHVAAEGMAGRDTPDHDIWEFGCTHKFDAIVTRDTDFLAIQDQLCETAVGRNGVPLLLFVGENTSTQSLARIFERNRLNIRSCIAKGQKLACHLSEAEGFRPLF